VPSSVQLDSSQRLTPIDRGDVCINYDKQWFAEKKLTVPTSLDDLVKPAYKGLLVVENPATSSPGLAFQLATIAKYGTDGWRDYWMKLRANDVKVDDGWESAYDGDFSQGANQGRYPLVVSYASSPPAAVYYSKPQPKTSPVGTMLDSCFTQVEFAGVIKGTEHRAAARKLVDFMLSARFQADVPLQMFVFPVRDGTPLPEVFTKFAEVPEHPWAVPPADIDAHRDAWIEQWTDTVLR
jgi:thiamine transport system substrate-binding protein